MRKIILGLVATAAIASPIALATSASASVAVDHGVGHVDKGDIQSSSVLNLSNGAFQTKAKAGGITFTANVENIVDYKKKCLGSTEFGHDIITQPVRYNVVATPVTNGNGSQVLGYDFDGTLGAPISAGQASMVKVPCPEGSFDFGPAGAPTQSTRGIVGGLQVNGIDLPNTPVEIAAPAA